MFLSWTQFVINGKYRFSFPKIKTEEFQLVFKISCIQRVNVIFIFSGINKVFFGIFVLENFHQFLRISVDFRIFIKFYFVGKGVYFFNNAYLEKNFASACSGKIKTEQSKRTDCKNAQDKQGYGNVAPAIFCKEFLFFV